MRVSESLNYSDRCMQKDFFFHGGWRGTRGAAWVKKNVLVDCQTIRMSGWKVVFFSIIGLSNFPRLMDGNFFFTNSIIIGIIQLEGKGYVRGFFLFKDGCEGGQI
jgi:hypothetical protein